MSPTVGRIIQRVGKTGAVPHDLLGHTADVDARATQPGLLDYGNLCPVTCGPIRTGDSTAATADTNQVITPRHRVVLHVKEKICPPTLPPLS